MHSSKHDNRHPWKQGYVFLVEGHKDLNSKRYAHAKSYKHSSLLGVLTEEHGWADKPELGSSLVVWEKVVTELLKPDDIHPSSYVAKEIYEDETRAYVTFVAPISGEHRKGAIKLTFEVLAYKPAKECVASCCHIPGDNTSYGVFAAVPVAADMAYWNGYKNKKNNILFGRTRNGDAYAINLLYDYSSFIQEDEELLSLMLERCNIDSSSRKYPYKLLIQKQEVMIQDTSSGHQDPPKLWSKNILAWALSAIVGEYYAKKHGTQHVQINIFIVLEGLDPSLRAPDRPLILQN